MRAGLLLRLVFYALGLYALHGALTNGVYYLHMFLTGPWENVSDFMPVTSKEVIAYGLIPLLFALGCFGFAGTMGRFLLGAAADERLDFSEASPVACLRVGTKLLGLYLIVFFAGPLIATLAELIMIKAGNTTFVLAQAGSDLIDNAIAVLIGYFLACRTDRVLKFVALHERP